MLAYLPVGVAVAAIALTYLFCLRPMRRTGCGHLGPVADASTAQELELARTELELLRLREQQRDRDLAA